jgi:acyl-homoserine-lactone acylase
VNRRLPLLVAAALLATTAPAVVAAPAAEPYDVRIRTTEYGIPHVEAADYASLGYGYGYSVASETICVLADTYTTVRAQRSRFFGPDAGYEYRANGSTVTNLNSDFFFQQIIDDRRVEKLLNGADSPKPQVREIVRGYVAGYNRWLASVGGAAGVTDPACKGKPWVTPITEMDAYRRFYQLALLASSGVAIDGIGGAQPPAPSAPAVPVDTAATADALTHELKKLQIGSNAVALGSAATDDGRGMLLGNPHFPWVGSERFYQSHLTIPGELDVAGGSLLGVPLILIGHTAHQAWSHTVSTSYRFTPFQETLVPGSPTTYLYDGVPTPMTSRTVTVDALVGGKVEKRTRTLWSTKHGPVFDSLLGIPLPWTAATAFAMGDANAPNFRYLNHFFDVNRAQSARDVLASLKRNQGIPWVNTLAADDAGDALYADISVTPHVTDTKARTCSTAVGQATFVALRLPVLDGSRSACEWGSDPDAVQPGTFGPSSMPSLIRRDYVTNSNDSYWLANPAQPLEGYAQIIGDERTERTTRTRSGLVMVAEELAGGGTFGRQELQDILYANRQHSFELTRGDLLTMCGAFPGYAPSSNGPVAVGNACDVLAAWDGTDNLDSRGALLFRRFWTRAAAILVTVQTGAQRAAVWKVPFDANDPVHTPRGLDVANPLVQRAFGDALSDLNGAGIAFDAKLGQYQVDLRPDGTATPYPGGPGALGVFNAMNSLWNSKTGYVGALPHGSSFVQAVSFDGDGCPDARTILTYSQSPNPRSPHYADQTRLYAGGGWVTDRFCKDDVRDHALTTLRLRG